MALNKELKIVDKLGRIVYTTISDMRFKECKNYKMLNDAYKELYNDIDSINAQNAEDVINSHTTIVSEYSPEPREPKIVELKTPVIQIAQTYKKACLQSLKKVYYRYSDYLSYLN